MRIAYFDCFSGISGDMTLGALVACGVNIDELRTDLAKLKLPGWEIAAVETSQNGIGAIDITVTTQEETGHGRHLSDIKQILDQSGLPESIRIRALKIFTRLAEAEAKIHQTTPERIHFHEVGAIDAIVDIVGSCLALEELGVEQIHCSPLPMGSGFVECMHGTIPLPAPAVLELTRDAPVYGADLEGELVTPTGAAIVTTLATSFGRMPAMKVQATGYGAGKKRFGNRPNLLRVVIGEAVAAEPFSPLPELGEGPGVRADAVSIETNLDDLSPQFYESAIEKLFASGALDVYLTPVQMKKGRPGTLLTILSPPDKAESLAGIVFQETTTLGIRFSEVRRICLEREWRTVQTVFGELRIKIGSYQGRETTASPEYEDVLKLARESGRPVKEIHEAAIRAYRQVP